MTWGGSGWGVQGAGEHQLPAEAAAVMGHTLPAPLNIVHFRVTKLLCLPSQRRTFSSKLMSGLVTSWSWRGCGGHEPCMDMEIRCGVSHELAAEQNTESLLIISPLSIQWVVQQFICRDHNSLAQNISTFHLPVWHLCVGNFCLSQRVIIVLHLYITSLGRILCSEQSPNGFTVIILWNTVWQQTVMVTSQVLFSVVWAQFNSL